MKCISASWNDIGRALNVPHNDRKSLLHNSRISDNDKLEEILHIWNGIPVSVLTWGTILKVLEECGKNNICIQVKEFLEKPENYLKYESKSDF